MAAETQRGGVILDYACFSTAIVLSESVVIESLVSDSMLSDSTLNDSTLSDSMLTAFRAPESKTRCLVRGHPIAPCFTSPSAAPLWEVESSDSSTSWST